MSRRRAARGAAARQQGYVLLMVVAALAVVAFVAMRFSLRIDELRRGAVGFDEYASARTKALSAQAATLYWMATRPMMADGRGDESAALRMDGRNYSLGYGAWVSVQDMRGLLSVNSADRAVLGNLLILDGVEPLQSQAWIDVLDDYLDTDDLRRLNGAEREDYRRQSLPAPRNDWLMTLRELEHLPLWRDDPERLARMSRWLSVSPSNQFNPATAPAEVLKAVMVGASPAQIDLLLALRKGGLLTSGAAAAHATGLALDREDYWFAPGWDSRITVWAPGLPRALEYNARLTPAGRTGPWTILEQHSTPRLSPSNEPTAAPTFPLPLVASEPSFPTSAAASRSP
ncbi:type II secretion system protein GspK [Pelomonas sp. SE-A7]|uniref:type II secretion system protein GspK n=1 Tax=Pelomonas sp. SE-A7 TaxID=3054953 RepID=UPI00259CC9F7|nr:type II secretion system protein GspK [Pelomonas sp. SE-A7]MDM4767543.1 type II secretion system protein GspK [Pelomonas sp. SE-A7]